MKKYTETLEEINQKARDAGLTYGKYVAKLTCKQLRDGTLKKYAHIETPEERLSRLYGNTSCYGVYDGELNRERGRKKVKTWKSN